MQITPSGPSTVELTRRECLELIGTGQVGRLGVVVGGSPEIFPVSYVLDRAGAVVFQTGVGTKLAEAVNHRVVFEVDQISPGAPRWSVVVHGVAHQSDYDSLRLVPSTLPSPLSGAAHTLRINPSRITGRRLFGRPPTTTREAPLPGRTSAG